MLNNKFNTNIKIIVDEYKHNEFLPLISPYKNEKEMTEMLIEGVYKINGKVEKRFSKLQIVLYDVKRCDN